MATGQSIAGGLAYKANNQARKDTNKANAELTRRMEVAREDYLARRPEAAQERMKALRAQLGLLSPMNKLTQEMGGGDPGYALDFGEVGQSPLGMTPLNSQLSAYDPKSKATTPITPVGREKLATQGYNVPASAGRMATSTSLSGQRPRVK